MGILRSVLKVLVIAIIAIVLVLRAAKAPPRQKWLRNWFEIWSIKAIGYTN